MRGWGSESEGVGDESDGGGGCTYVVRGDVRVRGECGERN